MIHKAFIVQKVNREMIHCLFWQERIYQTSFAVHLKKLKLKLFLSSSCVLCDFVSGKNTWDREGKCSANAWTNVCFFALAFFLLMFVLFVKLGLAFASIQFKRKTNKNQQRWYWCVQSSLFWFNKKIIEDVSYSAAKVGCSIIQRKSSFE